MYTLPLDVIDRSRHSSLIVPRLGKPNVSSVVSNESYPIQPFFPPPARIDRNVLRIGKERKVHNGARSYTRVCSRIWPRKVERDVVSTPGCANIDRGVAVTKNSTEREYGERWRGTGRRFREFRQILHFPSPSLPPSSSSSSSRSISFEDRSMTRMNKKEEREQRYYILPLDWKSSENRYLNPADIRSSVFNSEAVERSGGGIYRQAVHNLYSFE